MWIIPSELTDALRGIGGALGRGESGQLLSGDEEEPWVDPGPMRDAFDETTLEDPMQALAEARGQAGRASREATEHATPTQRVQPPIAPSPDAVPEYDPDPRLFPGSGEAGQPGEEPPQR
jgi:hypothetical protein